MKILACPSHDVSLRPKRDKDMREKHDIKIIVKMTPGKKVQVSGTFTAGRISKGNPMKTERCDKEKTPRRRASPFWRLALEMDEPAPPRAKPKSGSTPSGSPRQSVCNLGTAVPGLSTHQKSQCSDWRISGTPREAAKLKN